MNRLTRSRAPQVAALEVDVSGPFEGRRFSWFRLVVVVAVVGAIGVGAFLWFRWFQDGQVAAHEGEPWFAGYVDVTATPTYAMESASADGTEHVVLAFVVAPETGGCAPTWGGVLSLDDAASQLDLDRRIVRMTDVGREIVVSFGGQRGTELAEECTSVSALADAYREVVDRYDAPVVDLDLEGAGLSDTAAMDRRAAAIAAIQSEREDTSRPLRVWLTLPVGTSGLTAEGAAAVRTFLEAGVDLAGVNVMTMDFGTLTAGTSMAEAAESALTATHRQLGALWADAGMGIGSRALWRKLGATPMIGQNDVRGEVFGLDDARELNRFALEVGLGRMSMWSLNRDAQCSPNYPDPRIVSDACSGVEQGDERFSTILSAGFDGAPTTSATPTAAPTVVPDDPATSPYPIWSPEASYPAGTKVVWRGTVYVAKWWSQGDQPDDPTVPADSSPWRLVGPVLPGETPAPQPTLPAGFYPDWDPATVYTAGDRVMLDGVAFEARWWNQTSSPESALVDPGASPWRRLTDDEIRILLGEPVESPAAVTG